MNSTAGAASVDNNCIHKVFQLLRKLKTICIEVKQGNEKKHDNNDENNSNGFEFDSKHVVHHRRHEATIWRSFFVLFCFFYNFGQKSNLFFFVQKCKYKFTESLFLSNQIGKSFPSLKVLNRFYHQFWSNRRRFAFHQKCITNKMQHTSNYLYISFYEFNSIFAK